MKFIFKMNFIRFCGCFHCILFSGEVYFLRPMLSIEGKWHAKTYMQTHTHSIVDLSWVGEAGKSMSADRLSGRWKGVPRQADLGEKNMTNESKGPQTKMLLVY